MYRDMSRPRSGLFVGVMGTAVAALLLLAPGIAADTPPASCDGKRIVSAKVVALDQVISVNRLGANIPGGMIYALAGDVFPKHTGQLDQTYANSCAQVACTAGHVRLRWDKRPRPMVLRANEGDCLEIELTNLLSSDADNYDQVCSNDPGQACTSDSDCGTGNTCETLPTTVCSNDSSQSCIAAGECGPDNTCIASATLHDIPNYEQPSTRAVGLHVQGLNWASGPQDDGSWVGRNKSSLVSPGGTITYWLFAEHTGNHFLYNPADDWTALPNVIGGDGGTLAEGLFGSVNVEPSGFHFEADAPWQSEWFRSQVTHLDLCLASGGSYTAPTSEFPLGTCSGATSAPIIDYNATYPAGHPRAGLPILAMAACTGDTCEIHSSDLSAIITGPESDPGGNQPAPYFFPLNPEASSGSGVPAEPDLRQAYSYPDRLRPFREFTIHYHESYQLQQAFPFYYQSAAAAAASGTVGLPSLGAVADAFGINYSFAGLGSPILSNRLQVGPIAECVDCKYEEFFLSSWTGGDPGTVVDNPTIGCVDLDGTPHESCTPPNKALFPDDTSNVYHSYMSDHLKFRITHAGPDLHHLHHQHAHQWLSTPNSPDGDYLDSQSIGPGSSFTLEYVYGGSGNLNQTVGDSIFHCHFYPHFASGMWGLWRVHDVLELGSRLGQCPDGSYGCPVEGARALPDSEMERGVAIPAVVPMPNLPMAPLPAAVKIQGVCEDDPSTNCTTATAGTDCGSGQSCVDLGSTFCVLDNSGDDCIPMNQGTTGTWQQVGTGDTLRNPGYPFMIPGTAGSRAPHPPLDFAYACTETGEVCRPEPEVALPPGCTCEPLDGGLPRSVTQTSTAGTSFLDPAVIANSANPEIQAFANIDFSKTIDLATAVELPEDGTEVEKIAMYTHAQRFHATCDPDGTCAPCMGDGNCDSACNPPSGLPGPDCRPYFILNGLPPVAGAPYADPCIQFRPGGGPAAGAGGALTQRYLAADIQLDVVFNKSGWHFPQSRILSLWGDVEDTLAGIKPPEPLFFRVNSYDCVDYVLANLVPQLYELDDFQVRTPTDIIGQHIHLVKFDVTSSDGSANGWNYEDGTFAPNEVIERIEAINAAGGLLPTPGLGGATETLTASAIEFFGPGPSPGSTSWLGSQATVQRWYDDPLLNNHGACSNDATKACTSADLTHCAAGAYCNADVGVCSTDGNTACFSDSPPTRAPNACPVVNGEQPICLPSFDRTIRTVFTHDHFSPSTHQQTGLYAGLVVEPKGSQWLMNEPVPPWGSQDQCQATLGGACVMGGYDPSTGKNYPGRTVSGAGNTSATDGGPTSWQAVITMPASFPQEVNETLSFREFLFEIQDTNMFYQPWSFGDEMIGGIREPVRICGPGATQNTGSLCTADSECGGVTGSCGTWSLCSGDLTRFCSTEAADCGADGPCETVGFCAYNGVCVDSAGNTGDSVTRCLVAPPDVTSSPFSNTGVLTSGCPEQLTVSGKNVDTYACVLRYDSLVTCTPDANLASTCAASLPSSVTDDLRTAESELVTTLEDQGLSSSDATALAAETMEDLWTCNYITGVPASSWEVETANASAASGVTNTASGLRPGQYLDFVNKGIEAITVQSASYGFSFNYRNEPFLARLNDISTSTDASQPVTISPKTVTNYADLSWVFSSQGSGPRLGICSNDALQACSQDSDCDSGESCTAAPDPYPWPLTPGVQLNDPFTPLARAYPGDDVQFRTLVGAHINPHNFTLHGMNWLMEPSFVDSGWRNSQVMGISEHFELLMKVPPSYGDGQSCTSGGDKCTDFLVQPGAAALEQASGQWGLLRAYETPQTGEDLLPLLPQNQTFPTATACTPTVSYTVVALGPTTIQYNSVQGISNTHGMVFVDAEKLCPGVLSQVQAGTADFSGCSVSDPQPLVLRAAAGDCIGVTLYNGLDSSSFTPQDGVAWTPVPSSKGPVSGSVCSKDRETRCTPNSDCPGVCGNFSTISQQVGLRPQLVSYNPQTSDGTNAGFNAAQTVGTCTRNGSTYTCPSKTYTWYAGNLIPGDAPLAIEFGAANLLPSDPLNHYTMGLFAGLIIEPAGSKWCSPATPAGSCDSTTGIAAIVYDSYDNPLFREFTVFMQDDKKTLQPIPQGFNAINYRSGRLKGPKFYSDDTCATQVKKDFSLVLSDQVYCEDTAGSCVACWEPESGDEIAIFEGCAGEPTRFRLLHPGGINTNNTFELYAHHFLEAPYQTPAENCEGLLMHSNLHASQTLGTTSLCGSLPWLLPPVDDSGAWSASLNDWKNSRMGHGPSNHFDAVIPSAGGVNKVPGDYLLRSFPADHFNLGMWGLFRVYDPQDGSASGLSCFGGQ